MTASTGEVPGRIFMSYRREETAYSAAWLFDRLVGHFGRNQVFKDVDSIELGEDFVEVITTAVGACDVLLALIGHQWLTMTGQDGQRRLDDPHDFVRLEIEAALTRNVRVIPILVAGAQMPRAEELPASLAKLARRQALELSPTRFDSDTERLLRVLDRTISEGREPARQQAEAAARRRAQVEQLDGKLREAAAARDWDAVLAASGELATLDPAAADPDGLATVAREQLAQQRKAERANIAEQQRADDQQAGLNNLLRTIADEQGLTLEEVSARLPGWNDDLVEANLAGLGRPEWDFVGAFLDAIAGPDRDRREMLERRVRAAWEATTLPGQDRTERQELAPSRERRHSRGLWLVGQLIQRHWVIVSIGAVTTIIGVIIAIIIVTGPSKSSIVTGPSNSANSARCAMPKTSGTPHVRWVCTTGSWIVSSPVVVGGTVYIGSGDHKVYALNAATGKLRWYYRTGGWIVSSPVVKGGTVYIGSGDHKVYALNAATGKLRWAYPTERDVDSSPVVVRGTVYIGSGDHKVYALDAATGKLRWYYRTGGWIVSSPVVKGGTVYIGSERPQGVRAERRNR